MTSEAAGGEAGVRIEGRGRGGAGRRQRLPAAAAAAAAAVGCEGVKDWVVVVVVAAAAAAADLGGQDGAEGREERHQVLPKGVLNNK